MQALAWRDELLPGCAVEGGLGPPDLVWLRKAAADGRSPPEGSYHLLLAGEAGEQFAADYVRRLLLEQPTGLARLWSGLTELQGAIYCVYDAFGRQDVRTELSLADDGVAASSSVVDAQGAQRPAGEADWEGARVSAALRRLCWPARAGLAPEASCVRVLRARPGPVSPAAEREQQADVLALRARHGSLRHLQPAEPPPFADEAAPEEEMLLSPLLRHFLSQRRAAAAAAFLGKCAAAGGSDVAPLLAEARCAQGRLAEALAAAAQGDGLAHALAASRAHMLAGDAASAVECGAFARP